MIAEDIDHLTRISDTLQAADKYTLNKSTITGKLTTDSLIS